MAQNVLDRYGIKEVADLAIHKINPDGSIGDVVLLLDSLKVSTLETTAETVYAQGGKGNPRLIGWDYGREITLNVEDALYSPKSMAMIFGDGTVRTEEGKIRKTIRFVANGAGQAGIPSTWTDATGKEHEITGQVVGDDGEAVEAAQVEEGKNYYLTFDLDTEGLTINIDPNTFPGTYAFIGDTFARNDVTGEDEYFSFIIPRGKITSETSLTLEAEGDPTVFSFNVDVLRATDENGRPVMMQLKQYKL